MRQNKFVHRSIILSLLMILLMTVQGSSMVALAAQKGVVYISSAHAYYRHPITGIVEDPGNNEGIGQGMSDKMLNDEALIEKTEEGELYITIRLYLTQYISEVNFWTQERNTDVWTVASHQVMQENLGGEYCTDYRLKLQTEEDIIKCSFFVEPMGRAIIFFVDFSDWLPGSGDFIVSIDTAGQEVTDRGSADKESDDKGAITNPPLSSSNIVPVTEAAKNNAKELIASAKGLVISDETLLDKSMAASSETRLNKSMAVSSETRLTNEEETSTAAEENRMRALSWTLVWQCILIITLPGILTGSCLYLLIVLIGRKEGRR